MGFLIAGFKCLCFILFCLLSGFTLVLGSHESNIKKYYAFTAICLVGVMVLV